jgi:tetratricopeptide (TPR) repeat protein
LCRIYLGDTVSNQGKYEEAEQLLTKAIETERKIPPAENKELANALFILGELYVRKRTLDKAKALLKESVAMSDKLYGENNPDSAYTLISLGRAQMFAGDLGDAEETFRHSVEIHRRLPAKYEVRLGYALANLGRLLVTKKDYDRGIVFIREAYDIFLRKQGESFATFEAKAYICMAYFSKEDYGKVITEGHDAIALGRRLKLENAADFAVMLEKVGLARTRTGKAKDGEPFLREAVKIQSVAPAQESAGLAAAKSSLGECLTAQRQFAEAEALLKDAYESLKNLHGDDDSRTVLAKSRLEEVKVKSKK